MKLHCVQLVPFSHPDTLQVLPALTVDVMRCENPACTGSHGFSFSVSWLCWGIALEFIC
ncbi:MAG: hypothetical protein QM680_14560 [Luteolibacter sp.]